jgi:hypothetical protein
VPHWLFETSGWTRLNSAKTDRSGRKIWSGEGIRTLDPVGLPWGTIAQLKDGRPASLLARPEAMMAPSASRQPILSALT